MAVIGIFYGSTQGRAKAVAARLQALLGEEQAALYDVASASAEDLARHLYLIFGTSTYSYGDIQDDWRRFLAVLDDADLSGKKIALFGVGDQGRFPNTFINGVGRIYRELMEKEAVVVGSWPTEGYTMASSTAIKDGRFVGLALDQDTQPELTEARLATWAEILKREFA